VIARGLHAGARGRRGARSRAAKEQPADEVLEIIPFCQRFFPSRARSEFFEVRRATEPDGQAPHTASGAQQVKERLKRRMELVAEAERREVRDGEADEVNRRRQWLALTPHLGPTRKGGAAGHDGYYKKLGVLKERLRSGRNWDLLQEKFMPPILALVPWGGEYKIHDSE
ncbi:hypothetical protein MMC34_008424, partial [Xylographa carneopallida]|nr:hypothetical protein [Xylographa carneopallida]